LAQEAVVPPGVEAVYRPSGIAGRDGKTRRWGSAVANLTDVPLTPVGLAEGWWRGSLGVAPLDCVSRGHVAIATADLDGTRVTLISAYGLIEFGYAAGTMLRTIADLEPLFDDPDLGRNVILAGDFNVGTCWSRDDEKYNKRHGAVLHLIHEYGLVDCLDKHLPSDRDPLQNCQCGDPKCRHIWTYQRKGDPHAWQDDYLFATPDLARQMTSVAVPDAWDWDLSDHAPIVCTL
jgi:endonuclease/exonuclease/phosphatase family metal-dependent hydrolase